MHLGLRSLISLISLLFWQTASGYEVDQFTRRNEAIADSTSIIDAEINKRIGYALEASNPNSFEKLLGVGNCSGNDSQHKISRRDLFTNLRDFLATQNPIGLVESIAEKNNSVAKRRFPLDQSIYRTAADKSLILKKFGIASVISVNAVNIGTDKLGHFLNEGYEFYYKAHTHETSSEKMSSVLRNNVSSELGFSGMKTTLIKSYADMAANYDGSRFWERLCGRLTKDSTSKEREYFKKNKCLPNTYLKCESGKWILNDQQKFTLKDYVTPAWDETINCSSFHEDIEKQVQSELSRLAYMNNKNLKKPCPVEPDQCQNIKKSYPSRVYRRITHPSCLEITDGSSESEIKTGPKKKSSVRK